MSLVYSKVDKLEQSDAVRSEEEAKATDKPLVFSKNLYSTSVPSQLF